jgi:predicted DNA-binding antitoxin AbrB/MazE fold protein
MSEVIEAYFDGQVFKPNKPLALEPNTNVLLTIEKVSLAKPASQSFLQMARSLELKGPPDWSANVDSYLYGGEEAEHGRGVS